MIIISETRYGGVYEGGPWAAFLLGTVFATGPLLPLEAFGGDVEACQWWDAPTVPVGAGDSPDEALDRLVFLRDRDRDRSEAPMFEVGAAVRCARSTPDAWWGDGAGVVRSVEFRETLPFTGGVRGTTIDTIDFPGAAGTRVPERYLRPACPGWESNPHAP